MKKLKELRKELEKWLNIYHILKLNKEYVKELEAKDKIIDDLENSNQFYKINNEKLNSQVIKLKKEIEKCTK